MVPVYIYICYDLDSEFKFKFKSSFCTRYVSGEPPPANVELLRGDSDGVGMVPSDRRLDLEF